jgi:hypothetical protein
MKKYKIYGGIGGKIWDFIGFFVCDSLEEAEEIGRKYAMGIYQGYEGTYDMMSWEDCKAQMEKLNIEITKEKVDEYYEQVMSCWLTYSALEY